MTTHSLFQPGLLRGRSVFITGGGSGINRQIALTYALAGAAVTTLEGALGQAHATFGPVDIGLNSGGC